MAGQNATLEEIDAFLKEFQVKARVFGIDYSVDKEENLQTLLDLEIPASRRDEYILSLKPEDYYQGPDVNDYDREEGEVWMFGIWVKKRGRGRKIPIYIKVYITKANGAPNYCISFHIAKFTMTFPYKEEI
ncbi:MAG: toxin [Bacteroidales bacterium]|nr:toxin [Bacteroidales bacterium]